MKLGRFKDKLTSVITGIFRIKTKIRLKPISDLRKSGGEWISDGNDPAFLIEGNFFGGWNKISYFSQSEEYIPLKLYWDIGEGFSEKDSKVICAILPGSLKYEQFIYIPVGTINLRLDPGERELTFGLENLYFRKTTRLDVLLASFSRILKERGGGLVTFKNIINKTYRTYKTQGLKAIWRKAKSTLGIDSETSAQAYQIWIIQNQLSDEDKLKINREVEQFTYKPLISIILPVYNVDEIWLRKCIDSVINQIYPNWELCIADDASPKPHIKKVLREYSERDARIKVVFREKNGHISESSNTALSIAQGEFIGLLDNDDELTIDALYENVRLLNEHPDADMIYSDEDKISVEGERNSPFFKPDWSPDLLMTHMYVCHFGVYRTSLVKKIGGFRNGLEGSQDFDLALRVSELTHNIYHIPKILYHWRTIPESTASGPGAKNYTHYAGLKAVNDAIQRRGIDGYIEELEGYSNFYRVHYNNRIDSLVSIIIPTRDGVLLDQCLSSLTKTLLDKKYEIIIVNNGSSLRDTYLLFEKWKSILKDQLKIITVDEPFNYARINNVAVENASGELLLLLNDDIEVISSNWFDDMVGQAVREELGAVGAFLIYPDKTIQHSGLTLGLGKQRAAGDGHHNRPITDPGYFGAMLSVKNVSAVTAACLMVKKEIYLKVGGMDENLSVAYNDVDFCLKLRSESYLNIWLPYVQMIHHESKTRGDDLLSNEKLIRLNKEALYLQNKWGNILLEDPYYNPNLSLDTGYALNIEASLIK
ncbi:glycosyl transferase family protein [Paenibacillus vortex V453]|uniref:Glycosyl transferase family protein n=1 Tax=Paenibacillus vortex V453 TaxID=715225 RepID=A0A2R9SL93_9BACL|nr:MULTISPECIES: glycosyltransferase [Paenibacillus]AWP25482.1 glycosyl transferase family 2 [Paenibacillus sp. Cedars]EFU38127.1 glycosyl transferase family protein [Paenibacillus vortex V453]